MAVLQLASALLVGPLRLMVALHWDLGPAIEIFVTLVTRHYWQMSPSQMGSHYSGVVAALVTNSLQMGLH